MTHNLECASCEYLLRGLTLNDRCPECGYSTIDSHRIAATPSRRIRPYFVALAFGMLAAFVVPILQSPHMWVSIPKAKIRVARTEVASIAQQVNLFLVDSYPGINALSTFQLSDLTVGPDPYLKPADLFDPWGRPYLLMIPGLNGAGFSIASNGSDGVPGGDGDAADIVQE